MVENFGSNQDSGKSPVISAIAAIGARSRALGKNNALLWRIPEDMARVRTLTEGHTLIMGSNTFRSIGRALPRRENIVLSSSPDFSAEGVWVARSLQEALTRAREFEEQKQNGEVFIFGGAQVYRDALPFTERLYLTLVESEAEGDTFFPEYQHLFTREIERVEGEHEGVRYLFVTLEREHAVQ